MGNIGRLTDVHGRRFLAIRPWDNGYKSTFIDADTGEIPSRINCGGHWLVLNPDGIWVVEEKDEKDTGGA